MKVADVKVVWDLSVSGDVVSQVVALKLADGSVVQEVTLDAMVDEVVFSALSQKTDYVVTHVVSDGVNSAVASLSFNLGDLEVPAPVENLGVEVLKVYDVEE